MLVFMVMFNFSASPQRSFTFHFTLQGLLGAAIPLAWFIRVKFKRQKDKEQIYACLLLLTSDHLPVCCGPRKVITIVQNQGFSSISERNLSFCERTFINGESDLLYGAFIAKCFTT